MNAKLLIESIIKEKGTIRDVFFVACGGSLVDLYPGFYFISQESATMHAAWLTSKELVAAPPKHLGSDSLVIVCSHSGKTPESVEAAKTACARGAAVISLTHNTESPCNDQEFYPYIYEWSEDADEIDKPQGVVLSILNELMYAQEEDYKLYDLIKDGFTKIDMIIKEAMKKVLNATWLFAEYYHDEPYLYILASGASYSQAYGFAICSLQEMQWMDCCYLHSGEYFHGPFEVTDADHLYIVMAGTGKNRVMDERAISFISKYSRKLEVIDAKDYGMDVIDAAVVEYFEPMLFYKMTVAYRTALQDKRRHPLDMRRYMSVVEY